MKLFPTRKPYRTGYLKVGEGHELWYALYGNKKGIPVLFLHGGPGAGTSPTAHRNFNPKRFNILTIDQRGAGRSRPFASTKANTTGRLVDDLKRFLDFLGIPKTYIFGGSWGSTLALCYAIKYPETVKGMVLRGIWLCTRWENEYALKGGWRTHFPEVWERLVSHVPQRYKENPAPYYWRKLTAKDPKTVLKYAREWALYEHSLLSIDFDPKKSLKAVKGKWAVSLARLEACYMRNGCFIPEGYILKNAHKLKGIPLSIIHGRYDFVTLPENAWQLHHALPKSKLFFVKAAHTAGDRPIQDAMMREMHRMARA